MAKLRPVANIQTMQKVTIKIRGTIAIARDYAGGDVDRPLAHTTIAAWAEELAAGLRRAEPPKAQRQTPQLADHTPRKRPGQTISG